MKIGFGGKTLAVLGGLAIIALALDRYVGTDRIASFFGIQLLRPGLLSPGDFPPGASAPAGDAVSLPSRPIRIWAVPRGAVAPLVLVVGGARTSRESPLAAGYGLEAEFVAAPDDLAVRDALAAGGARGGADVAALTVDALASMRPSLRYASPRAVALLGKSRGHEAIAAARGLERVEDLKGRTLALAPGSPSAFFALWRVAHAGLHERSVRVLRVAGPSQAAQALRDGRADAAAGFEPELAVAARERGGKVVATSADAPHLVATVLVVRGEFAAQYAEAVRRLVRAIYDAVEGMAKDATPAAKMLGAAGPSLGDPRTAIESDPPARLREGLAFFGVAGDAPVRYDELYQSAAAVWSKLGESADAFPPAESRDLFALRAARAADERKAAEAR